MQRKSFGNMQCPVARSLERVGEWWSILILRDAFYGLRRFDEFEASLGIAPTMLTRRLKALVDAGLLERRPYQDRPVRHEYVLTDMGRDFRPVLLNLIAWGNRHFAPEGTSVEMRSPVSDSAVDPGFLDRASGMAVPWQAIRIAPGPAASEQTRRRIARATSSSEEIVP